ncbi:hypothetical protein FRAAL3690 [Frankia alni ACN14a]|uniref:Uncharacterized protein n=2 Tax=Frankiaceae TaxID=74712 RepID=Q0RJH9_FRAAA|nr:hypothetical protein FRAAL3690 [Frankia alni ACN14a]
MEGDRERHHDCGGETETIMRRVLSPGVLIFAVFTIVLAGTAAQAGPPGAPEGSDQQSGTWSGGGQTGAWNSGPQGGAWSGGGESGTWNTGRG